MKVGVLGLGLMGTALANSLLSKKHEVHVYNRTQEKTLVLVEKGATGHSSPAELGRAVEVAVTFVSDHAAVEEVTMGEKGLLRGLREGSLWVDMSTIDPDASKRHAEESVRRGIERLDIPVVASPQMMAEGRGIFLAGGPKGVFEKYQPFLASLASQVLYFGESGSGHRMKLVMNLYLALMSLSFSEALAFSQGLGFDPSAFVETVNKTAHKNYLSEVKGVKMAKGDFEPSFSLKMMLKDVLLADGQAKLHKIVLPLSSLATQIYTMASNLGQGEMDYSSVVLLVQTMNAMKPLEK